MLAYTVIINFPVHVNSVLHRPSAWEHQFDVTAKPIVTVLEWDCGVMQHRQQFLPTIALRLLAAAVDLFELPTSLDRSSAFVTLLADEYGTTFHGTRPEIAFGTTISDSLAWIDRVLCEFRIIVGWSESKRRKLFVVHVFWVAHELILSQNARDQLCPSR